MKTTETISLEKKDQKKVTKETNELKKKIKAGKLKEKQKKAENKRGLIYIGHIPHGFYEKEMQEYFKQFGKVTNVRVCRSARTGNSKGYGYVEFVHPEVAKIAAETMNNYIMFKRRLVAQFIPADKRPPHLFSRKQITAENYPLLRRRTKVVAVKNKDIDDQTHLKRSKKALKKLNKTIEKLKKFGIDYDLKPLDVPEGIEEEEKKQKNSATTKKDPIVEKKKENTENDYINDSVDSEIAFKVSKIEKTKGKSPKPSGKLVKGISPKPSGKLGKEKSPKSIGKLVKGASPKPSGKLGKEKSPKSIGKLVKGASPKPNGKLRKEKSPKSIGKLVKSPKPSRELVEKKPLKEKVRQLEKKTKLTENKKVIKKIRNKELKIKELKTKKINLRKKP